MPVDNATPEEIRVEMKKAEPFSEEFENARFRLVAKLDAIREREGVEGFTETPVAESGYQAAQIDPATGKIAWRALACFNPECPARGKGGGPFLFVFPLRSIKIGPDGKLMIDKTVNDLDSPLGAVCPACGKHEFCRAYDSAKSELRRRQLMEELAQARAAARTGASGSQRSVAEIMSEMGNLPKLFLVAKPEEVGEFGRVHAPKSRGIGTSNGAR